jgi:hypothetical protein
MKTMTLSLLALCLSITTLHAQWEKSSGLTALAIHALAVDPDAPGTLYAGTERGLYISKDTGRGWIMANNGLKYNEVWSIAAKNGRLLAGSFETVEHGLPTGDVSLSTDGGRNWTSIDGGRYWTDANKRMAAHGALALGFCRSGFLAATSYGIFLTTDTGATWSLAPGSPRKEFVYFASTPCGLFAGSHFDGPYRSQDDGVSWRKMDVSVKWTNLTGITCTGNTIYVTGWTTTEIHEPGVTGQRFGSAIFRSTDAGEHWSELPIPPALIIEGIHAAGDTLIATFDSSDPSQGGINVVSIQFPKPLVIEQGGISIAEAEPSVESHDKEVTDSTEGPAGVHVSIDGGKTWMVVNDGLPVTNISSLAVRDGYVFAGTYIAGLYRRPLAELVAAARAGGEMKRK